MSTPKQPENLSAPPILWHTLDIPQLTQSLTVTVEQGLSDGEAQARITKYGKNELIEKGTATPLELLIQQLTDPLVLILIGAAVISGFLGEWKSVFAISAIVTVNAILGVSQEYRAEKAMAALKKMSAPSVRVRRNGNPADIDPELLVPGDVVLLEAGSIIPADARLIEANSLLVQEASLTGESHAVEKNTKTLKGENIGIADRHNMVFMGTSVTNGRAVAIVTETGMKTQLGRIAELIQAVDNDKTPLQRRMAQLGRVLFFLAIGIVAVGLILGLLRGISLDQAFLAAVAIAVAVVPEGLPAVVTVCLALGAKRMLARRALIRKLPAVETLGSVTVICSDKTGTLTENKMTVKVIDVAGHTHDVTEITQKSKGLLALEHNVFETPSQAEALLLAGADLCNDAMLQRVNVPKEELRAMGDPTESALVVAAAHFAMWKDDLENMLPRVGEVPFSSERKRMATVHEVNPAYKANGVGVTYLQNIITDLNTPYVAFVKGGVDGMVDVCDRVWDDGQVRPLTPDYLTRINDKTNELASKGLRVLGVALKPMTTLPAEYTPETVETGLIFAGMIGMIDPPRMEVKQAVAECHQAGIRVVMITGDHPLTALTIAKELGITKEDKILTGAELTKMSQAQLEVAVRDISVYARVSPEHKLNIVQALQANGQIASMTGDGVNDAPALKRADIGVAMGITGTPVTKEASDMVILDDNFATIVNAAQEGRAIYDNVRKFIKYILASNIGEVIALFITQLAGKPLPLNTIQILWMNLVTDGLPALALGVEKGEPNNMKRPPHNPKEGIFARGLGGYLLRVGLIVAFVSLALVFLVPSPAGDDARNTVWSTMIFTTLTLSQMGHAMAIRSERESIFKIGFFGNKFMLMSIGGTVLLQLVLIYAPFANDFFYTVPLSLSELAVCFGLAILTFFGVEFDKWFFVRRKSVKTT
ncbi:MAG: cation-translocating P-type ATPase [bacterium]|nr:cation-translocating P-type ATPase [bacterium]